MLRPFASSKVIKEQTGRYVPFKMFWEKYMDKFQDKQIENPDDVINILWQEPLFDEIAKDISEP